MVGLSRTSLEPLSSGSKDYGTHNYNFNMPKILKIPSPMKHNDEQGFDVISLSYRSNVVI